jgi:Tol biopolymer transport system component
MNAKPTLAGLAASAALVLACNPDKGTLGPTAGAVQVSAATSGADLDPDGYSVIVDSGAGLPVGVNGVVVVSGLSSGTHIVTLAGIATNCTTSGANPRSVNVVAADTAQLAFGVSCTAITTTGALQVTTVTTGESLDPDGYSVSVDNASSQAIAVNGTVTVRGVLAGSHLVTLRGVAVNCSYAGANPRPLTVIAGDTIAVSFAITCGPVTQLAFVSVRPGYIAGSIALMNTDGSGVVPVTSFGSAPAWSADGTRIAFQDTPCCGSIYVVNADGTGLVRLTNTYTDDAPAWSPDGNKIAFQRFLGSGETEIYVMNANGTGVTQLTSTPGGFNGHPSWSPDRSRITFTSYRDGNNHIYVMNADGSGVVRLTSDPTHFDLNPAWSPDGSKIAFLRDDVIYVMNADGSSQTNLNARGDANEGGLSWSPDGAEIAFGVGACDDSGCYIDIGVVRADGSDGYALTRDHGSLQPAWRPRIP